MRIRNNQFLENTVELIPRYGKGKAIVKGVKAAYDFVRKAGPKTKNTIGKYVDKKSLAKASKSVAEERKSLEEANILAKLKQDALRKAESVFLETGIVPEKVLINGSESPIAIRELLPIHPLTKAYNFSKGALKWGSIIGIPTYAAYKAGLWLNPLGTDLVVPDTDQVVSDSSVVVPTIQAPSADGSIVVPTDNSVVQTVATSDNNTTPTLELVLKYVGDFIDTLLTDLLRYGGNRSNLSGSKLLGYYKTLQGDKVLNSISEMTPELQQFYLDLIGYLASKNVNNRETIIRALQENPEYAKLITTT